ncbi:hypothetical protein FBBAL38_00045 [Flavobacteria bacterium BAL38]|nr:hypothetical protein FBBAL38_00045 [Flavobacteria bacterium BAL38]
MELLEKLSVINKTSDVSQVSFLTENLDVIINQELEDIQSKDYRTLGYPLYSLMKLNENYRTIITNGLSKYLIVDKPNSNLNFIAWILMHVSEFNEVEVLLDKILFSNNYEVQKVLFYHEVSSEIYYVQTEKFRQAIVDYVNSDFFKIDYPIMQTKTIHHAFPGQYFNTFNYRYFLPVFKEGVSKSKQQKLVTEYRLNSIRLIKDDEMKSVLVRLYYYRMLPTLYKSRFVELVKREIPNLKLDWY